MIPKTRNGPVEQMRGSDPTNRLTWSQTTVLIMTCRPHPPTFGGPCDLIRACPPTGVAHPSPVHKPPAP